MIKPIYIILFIELFISLIFTYFASERTLKNYYLYKFFDVFFWIASSIFVFKYFVISNDIFSFDFFQKNILFLCLSTCSLTDLIDYSIYTITLVPLLILILLKFFLLHYSYFKIKNFFILFFSIIIIFNIINFIFFKKGKGKAIGEGDIYLLCSICGYFSAIEFLLILFFSSIFGSIYFLFKRNEKNYIPFAPFVFLAIPFSIFTTILIDAY